MIDAPQPEVTLDLTNDARVYGLLSFAPMPQSAIDWFLGFDTRSSLERLRDRGMIEATFPNARFGDSGDQHWKVSVIRMEVAS